MLIDITLEITPKMLKEEKEHPNPALAGHLGTHFDGMDQEFPLEYTRRKGVVFDVSTVSEREIGLADVELQKVEQGMFVAFYSGYIEQVGYGEEGYFSCHPQLSKELIEALVQKEVSVIGLDFAGVRRGGEHTPTDQYCAERGTFIVENLCNLKALLPDGTFIAHIYPMHCPCLSGRPCRVLAEI